MDICGCKYSPRSVIEQSSGRLSSNFCVLTSSGCVVECVCSSWIPLPSAPSSTVCCGEFWLDRDEEEEEADDELEVLPVLAPPPPSSSRLQYSLASSGVKGRSNRSGKAAMSSRSLRVELDPPVLYDRLRPSSASSPPPPPSSLGKDRAVEPPPPAPAHSWDFWCFCTSA